MCTWTASIFLQKYGVVEAGWSKLDLTTDGKLSYVEFATALRAIGVKGDIKGIWREMDQDI